MTLLKKIITFHDDCINNLKNKKIETTSVMLTREETPQLHRSSNNNIWLRNLCNHRKAMVRKINFKLQKKRKLAEMLAKKYINVVKRKYVDQTAECYDPQ